MNDFQIIVIPGRLAFKCTIQTTSLVLYNHKLTIWTSLPQVVHHLFIQVEEYIQQFRLIQSELFCSETGNNDI